MQVLRLTGIEEQGRHGASDGEQDAPQPFAVDLTIGVEAEGDDLGSTADYRAVVAAVREVIAGESHFIIETIAERIADQVAALPGARWCRVVVHKPAAAERHGLGDISAEAASGTALPQGA